MTNRISFVSFVIWYGSRFICLTARHLSSTDRDRDIPDVLMAKPCPRTVLSKNKNDTSIKQVFWATCCCCCCSCYFLYSSPSNTLFLSISPLLPFSLFFFSSLSVALLFSPDYVFFSCFCVAFFSTSV